MNIKYIEEKEEKEKVSTAILSFLPEWFGLVESTKMYIEESKEMPFWCVYEKE